MLSARSTLHSIWSFRLGYAPWPQQPYPGRWTTPSILCLFALLTAFLACINVPLSAYEFVQEPTYRPNDTLSVLPLSRWLPSVLQPPASSFEPQVLVVGDTVTLNNSITGINFTISSAFDVRNGNTPASTFSYYNNPLSDACDVSNISFHYNESTSSTSAIKNYGGPEEIFWFSAQVICDLPETRFTLTWEDDIQRSKLPFHVLRDFLPMEVDFVDSLKSPGYSALYGVYDWYAEVELHSVLHEVILEYDLIPACPKAQQWDADCLYTQPVAFRSRRRLFYIHTSEDPNHPTRDPNFDTDPERLSRNATSADEPFPVPMIHFRDPNYADMNDMTDVSAIIHNVLQSRLHLIRLELGVIHPNLIYASAEMYNQSILPSTPEAQFPSINESRAAMADEAFFGRMQETVRFYNTTDRVPIMEYSRTVPRLKPLGSAITSVFVSTFAMLSTIWTVFSLVAGVLAKMYADNLQVEEENTGLYADKEKQDLSGNGSVSNESVSHGSGDEIGSLRQRVNSLELEMRRLQLSLKRRRLSEDKIPEHGDGPDGGTRSESNKLLVEFHQKK
ncbi:hypothetical protein R3P38DRAFT_3460059 [Favolaschia claudopus]|uniref:Uncharacterized protein n=1 Tax=Favolaschia claudopus TaxID=2862362 RepID=A0AAV9ZGL3_9AGAR